MKESRERATADFGERLTAALSRRVALYGLRRAMMARLALQQTALAISPVQQVLASHRGLAQTHVSVV
jgi:hypothetical protein